MKNATHLPTIGHPVTAYAHAGAQPIGLADILARTAVSGPCEAQAHWSCTQRADALALAPAAMLPGSNVEAEYVPMCQNCKGHLADEFLKAVG
jgi:hypothetical protein